MVRSIGIAAVIVGLAWTGLAGAQSSAPPGASAPRQRYMIVREEGKPPQRCLLLKTWKQETGFPAFQVQAVDTGEVMTVATSGSTAAGGDPRTLSSRIYRWGSDNLPPEGAPQPSPTATGLAAPLPMGAYAPRSESVSAPKVSDIPALSTTPRPTPAAQMVQKPDATPAPGIPTQQNSIVRSNPPPVTPRPSTAVAQQPSIRPSSPTIAPPRPTPAAQIARKPDSMPAPMISTQQNSIVRSNPLPVSPRPNTQVAQQPPIRPSSSTVAPPRATPAIQTARKPDSTPAPVISTPQNSFVRSNPPLMTQPKITQVQSPPKITQVVQQPPIRPSSPAAAPQIVTPKASASTSISAAPRPIPAALTAQKPDMLPAPPPTNSGYSMVGSKPPPLTPMSTQVVQQPTVCKPCPCTPTQPRLTPTPCGAVAGNTPSNCACPPPCDPCCKPCDPCSQKACACDTTSAKRQPIGSRLFKSNSSNTSTVVVSNPGPLPAAKSVVSNLGPLPAAKPTAATPPAPTLVKADTQPAKPGDWRESWGKVEPWKNPAQASKDKPAEPTKRVDATPVRMDPPKQPDPIKAPEHYRDLAMNTSLAHSKIVKEDKPTIGERIKSKLTPSKAPIEPMPPGHATEVHTIVSAPPPNGAMPTSHPPVQPRNGVIELAADEPNAFWSPPKPPKAAEENQDPKNNAFDRAPEAPPQGIQPARPGMAPMPPRGPVMAFPRPPLPPGPPPSPSRPDMGVPSAMANAFTLSGTGRPIPADFGGTPQEPNGFDQSMQGDGSPPLAYGMGGAPRTPRPPMPNMMAMAPQAPNSLMSVPRSPQSGSSGGFAGTSPKPAGVSEVLATLKNSLYPSDRETAAEQLSELNWRVQPLVVESLMKSARDDPAATVRAACIHALAVMKVNTAQAAALVRNLKNDRDPRVRQEAEEALSTIGDSSIQQASHK